MCESLSEILSEMKEKYNHGVYIKRIVASESVFDKIKHDLTVKKIGSGSGGIIEFVPGIAIDKSGMLEEGKIWIEWDNGICGLGEIVDVEYPLTSVIKMLGNVKTSLSSIYKRFLIPSENYSPICSTLDKGNPPKGGSGFGKK